MATKYASDFDAEPLGEPPTDWTVTPTGTATIILDPIAALGRCVKITRDDPGPGRWARCRYTFPLGIVDRIVTARFWMAREEAPGSEDFEMVGLGPSDEILFGIQLRPGGQLRYYDDHDFSPPQTWSSGVWKPIRVVADLLTRTYDVHIGSTVIGEHLAFHESGNQLKAIQFSLSAESVQRTAYFDNVEVTYFDKEADVPTVISLSTAFEGDQAAVQSVGPGETTPNDRSSTHVAGNVLTDGLGQSWRSVDTSDGIHALDFDFGSAFAPDLVAILGHNLGAVTIGFQSLTLAAKSTLGQSWGMPEFELDLSSRRTDEVILAWIPPGKAYRYWRLAITGESVVGVDFYEIGRVILTTHFVPSRHIDLRYRWGIEDPSIITSMRQGVRQSRIKPAQRVLQFGWQAMPEPDQATLIEDLFARGGAHRPWLILIDPATRPQTRTIYGYSEDDSVTAVRGYREHGALSLAIREIAG